MSASLPHGADDEGLDQLADAVARRVVELLAAAPAVVSAPAAGPRLLTARQVADRLGRSCDWVRAHRAELGQVPGVGARPRLLFDASAVDAWANARDEVVQSPAPDPASPLARARARRPRAGSGPDLLPVARPIVDRKVA